MKSLKSMKFKKRLAAVLLTAATLVGGAVVGAPAASAAPLSNPSIQIPVKCPGARADIQIEWEGTRSARVHWALEDSAADRKSPVLKIQARDDAGNGSSWTFRNDNAWFSLDGGRGDSSSGGGHSWDPAGIAQFNHLLVSVSNGTGAEGTACTATKRIYDYTRLAYQYALNQSDKPYVWGAEGPNSFDCSGLVHFSYNRVPNFPDWSRMSSAAQYDWARAAAADNNASNSNLHRRDAIRVSRSDLKIGDIVFYSGHVGFYAGGGRLYSALNPSSGIGYNSVDFKSPLGYYRIVGAS